MLRSYVTKKYLFFYFVAIMITWLEAVITPALIQYIVSSLPITSCICCGRS
ncbi:ABC transporter [Streptococcus gordonii]|nr:ABC transporter [Streptococcus gordonii]